MAETFNLQVSDFIRKTKLSTDTVVRKVGADVLRSVVEKSPVDTGRFRANWVVSYAPTDATLPGFDRTGIDAINRGLRLIQVFRPEDGELWISNNLPYARRLVQAGTCRHGPAHDPGDPAIHRPGDPVSVRTTWET